LIKYSTCFPNVEQEQALAPSTIFGYKQILAKHLKGRLAAPNLVRRVIVPKLQAAGIQCWSGWHGFRRGLATNLYELGEDETTIQAILRHADLNTTRRH
jgi:integrase